jgi:hypothetical protein
VLLVLLVLPPVTAARASGSMEVSSRDMGGLLVVLASPGARPMPRRTH